MPEFISEDDLSTFEGWLKYQAIDAATATAEELENWRSTFDEVRESAAATSKVGLMKLGPLRADEYRYAVAVRDGSDLWLTLWVRRSPKPEFFVFMPRGDRGWDPHASYHRDGTLHQKSFDQKFAAQKRRCLTGAFRGTEHLGAYMGHGPKGVGAVCNPTAFSGVVEVAPDLGLTWFGKKSFKTLPHTSSSESPRDQAHQCKAVPRAQIARRSAAMRAARKDS
jgi:hypothetical protein